MSTCISSVATGSDARNGTAPVSSSYSTTPSEYTSLRAILDRALAKDPARRFESAAQMAATLRRTISDGAGEPTTRRLAAAARRGPTAWIAITMVVVAFAAVVWASRDFMSPDGAPPETAPATTTLPALPPPSTSAPPPEPTPLAPRAIARVTATPQLAPTHSPSAAPTEEPVAAPPPATAEEALPPVPSSAPTAEPPPSTVPAPALLILAVQPWAEVELDGTGIGMTPMGSRKVSPGSHVVVLKHPSYQRFTRSFTVEPGERFTLRFDFKFEGIPLKP